MIAPAKGNRFTAFDRLRGLIMVLMAIDHASYFIARTHALEDWANSPPFYQADTNASLVAAFLTRWVSHLCAPGFFMLMGASMVWLSNARQKDGWSPTHIRNFFFTRGAILVVLQQIAENPAWLLGVLSASASHAGLVHPPGGGSNFILHFGVISTLGAAMILWAFLLALPNLVVLAASGLALGASVAMTPLIADYPTLFPVWRLVAFVPSHANLVNVMYPIVPWLAPVGLGIVLGRIVSKSPERTVRLSAATGLALLAIFVVARLAGTGDPHAPLPGVVGFLSLTKYPPSPAFLAATLGLNFLLVAALTQASAVRWLSPLEVFGRSPLFFYFAHLYVFGALSFAFRDGASLPVMYVVWATVLAAVYPACRWYARFKAAKPVASLWRLL